MEIRVRGRLGNDPELKTVGADNLSLASFSLAHTPRSNWYLVIKFGASAEAIAQTLKKGDEVIVIGSLKLNTYTDKNGIEKSQMEISASEIGVVPKVTKNKTQTNTGGSEPW